MSFLTVLEYLCYFLPQPIALAFLLGIAILALVVLLKLIALILDAIPFL